MCALVPASTSRAPEPAELLERVRGRYISTLHLVRTPSTRTACALLETRARGRRAPSGTLRWALIGGARAVTVKERAALVAMPHDAPDALLFLAVSPPAGARRYALIKVAVADIPPPTLASRGWR